MKKIIFASILMSFMFLAGQSLIAAAPDTTTASNEPNLVSSDKVMGLAKEINLTDEQAGRIQALTDSSKRDILNLRHEIAIAVMDIQDELKKETSDENTLKTQAAKIADNQEALMMIRINNMLEIKKILSPEQFQKLTVLLENKKSTMKKKFFEKLTGNK
jgi:Spy/CpxP family protein refolding chaperone